MDTKFLEKHINKKKQKNDFLKSKYKYKDMKSKQLGTFKSGILNINKNDFKRINGNNGGSSGSA